MKNNKTIISLQENYLSPIFLLPSNQINSLARQQKINIFKLDKNKNFAKLVSSQFKVSYFIVPERLREISKLNLDNFANKIFKIYSDENELLKYINNKNQMIKDLYLSEEECNDLIKYIVKYSTILDNLNEKE